MDNTLASCDWNVRFSDTAPVCLYKPPNVRLWPSRIICRLRIMGVAWYAGCCYCHDMVHAEDETNLVRVGLAEDVFNGLLNCWA